MFLAFLLGCSTLAGVWRGVWVCSDQMFEEAEASEFDVDLELLAVSKYGFEGTLTMEGEVMIEDDEGDTNSWTWWSESAVRMEMTEFGGPPRPFATTSTTTWRAGNGHRKTPST